MALAKRAAFPADPQRRALLAKVHIAQIQLGMTEEDYRAILHRVTGKISAGQCDVLQLQAVVAEFTRKGFRAVQVGPKKGSGPRRADHPVARKARAMWISLGLLCAIDDHSEKALEEFASRQMGCATFQWANQAQGDRLIEALKGMGVRHGWRPKLKKLAKIYHVHALKRALCEAILVKLKRAAAVPKAYDLGAAAWKLCRLSDPEQYSFDTDELDEIANGLGKVLRTRYAETAFDEVQA